MSKDPGYAEGYEKGKKNCSGHNIPYFLDCPLILLHSILLPLFMSLIVLFSLFFQFGDALVKIIYILHWGWISIQCCQGLQQLILKLLHLSLGILWSFSNLTGCILGAVGSLDRSYQPFFLTLLVLISVSVLFFFLNSNKC